VCYTYPQYGTGSSFSYSVQLISGSRKRALYLIKRALYFFKRALYFIKRA